MLTLDMLFTTCIVLVTICATVVSACHPVCRWQSDDPVCRAVCEPKCQEPVCTAQCQVSAHESTCAKPQCWVRCAADMCESDQCPTCETMCNPYFYCSAPGAVCSPLCEETRCSWSCRKPIPGKECPLPRYELQCERPACEYSGSLVGSVPVTYVIMVCVLIHVCMIA